MPTGYKQKKHEQHLLTVGAAAIIYDTVILLITAVSTFGVQSVSLTRYDILKKCIIHSHLWDDILELLHVGSSGINYCENGIPVPRV